MTHTLCPHPSTFILLSISITNYQFHMLSRGGLSVTICKTIYFQLQPPTPVLARQASSSSTLERAVDQAIELRFQLGPTQFVPHIHILLDICHQMPDKRAAL